MVSPSSLQVKSSSSALSFVKFKALLHTLILSLARAISRAKSTLAQILKHASYQRAIAFKKNKNKLLFGSFRLHYNWCSSSHVMPVPPEIYYDSTWPEDGGITAASASVDGPQLTGYLQWLEERKEGDDDGGSVNEIDELAEIFIANCHEKFRLEKQESYRRFQDMLARSL